MTYSFCLLALLCLTAVIYALVWRRFSVNPADYPWLAKARGLDGQQREQWLNDSSQAVIKAMSLKEQQAQLSGDGGPQFLLRLGINIFVLGRFPNTYAGRNNRLAIPPLSFSDGPRGIVINRATGFPVAMARAASWDTRLETRVAECFAKEARAVGANYFAGLCTNLLRHPAWGRAQECYGEDPFLTAAFGCAVIDGLEQHNVMTCAKHFAVNSIENSRFYVDVNIDPRSLHEVYLPHFKAMVDHGVPSIMSAYNQLNGQYCGHNAELLDDILRKQWGFKGFVSSDWLWGVYDCVDGVNAGMDVEMPFNRQYGYKLTRAIKQGKVKQETIQRNAERVIRTKLDYISRPDPQHYPATLLACEEHQQLALESAEQSMVLLKNDNLLPLDKNQQQSILLLGELADTENQGDHGSSRVSPPSVCTIKNGLQNYLQGSSTQLVYNQGKNLEEVSRLSGNADVVIVIAGYRFDEEGENLKSNHTPPSEGGKQHVPIGGDRMNLSLSSAEQQLIETAASANSKTLVGLIGGSAIITKPWDQTVSSIVMAWYPGMRGGEAFSNIIFGETTPCGHLPFSIPEKESDLVSFDAFAEQAEYGYFHGYTLLDQQQKKAAYPFGFGLSYTQFSYSDIQLESTPGVLPLKVSCTVSNTGNTPGKTVAQLYVGFTEVMKSSGIERHPKLLRGFEKLELQPGESSKVVFKIESQQLARFEENSKQWITDPGSYSLMIGDNADSAEKLKLTAEIA